MKIQSDALEEINNRTHCSFGRKAIDHWNIEACNSQFTDVRANVE